ncbi:lipopolysaccharide transport periplasmic protein LptA [Curvibacter sp. APW13]|uniref:lipopolysaccharide transport periplasmic protein LptA n=1 Tax=Curvibacter sp. APW13 TaxID=3077236 RepID=UPI0028DFF68D|nr:lipopolysaccharide transport periplasmic protein LptA [Curvibacter sp. APW13]MDT8990836.1 lipopolysaccharide transport periplasmic protein LptA [Curvibacter sp. APW13]
MTHHRLPCVLAVVLALSGTLAQAENADKSKPMNIEADSLRYDDARQVSVFTGKVVITKGSIVIRGQQVEVRQDAQGNQFGIVTASSTEPAFFRQKREGVDEYIEGEAQTIEYDSKADTVRFVQKAQLRRFRGATLADQISGATIVYDNTKDLFTVDGGVRQGSVGSGRVRAMLTPKPDGTAPSTPGANLRPTTSLPGASQ